MLKLKDLLNKAYEKLDKIPWDTTESPEELVQLINTEAVKPCKTLDIGCGAGHQSVYLARQGFDVTGIDIAEKAIAAAKENAERTGVNVNFQVMDALNVSQLNNVFDFVLEWGLLHFIMPEFRERYVKEIARKINFGGKYIVLTFNEESPEWGGGKYRVGLTGAPLYYSSTDELKELYEPYFKILESKIRPTFFKNSGNKHLENYLFLERN